MTDKQVRLLTCLQKKAYTTTSGGGATLLDTAGKAVEKGGKGLIRTVGEGIKDVGKPVAGGIKDVYVWALKNLVIPMLLIGPAAVGAATGVTHAKLTSPTKESEQAKLRELEAKELARTLAVVRRKRQLAQQTKVPDGSKPLFI